MTSDLPLARLKPGSLNPRKHFDPVALAELEASIEQDGVLSNLIVRPTWCIGTVTGADLDKAAAPFAGKERAVETTYEIVSGERRYRAAIAVGKRNPALRVINVPVRVKAMTDPEVLAINLTEQLTNRQLTAVEEAQAYADLLAYKDEEGRPIHTAEQLGARVSKTADHIYSLLKLLTLPPAAKQAVADGTLAWSIGKLIARVPDATRRAEFAKVVMTGGRDGASLTEPETRTVLHEKFQRVLKEAPFNQEDADLVPAAGACSGCSHRSGNLPDFGGHGARANICTNTACFESKCQAAFMQVVAVANRLGVKVATDKESAGYFETHRNTEVRIDSDWVELDTKPMTHLLKADVNNPPVWRELYDRARVAGMMPEVVLAKDGGGRGRWLVNSTLLIAAAEKLGEPIFKGQKGADDVPVTPLPGEDPDDAFRRGKRELAEKQRQETQQVAEQLRLKRLVLVEVLRTIHGGLQVSWVDAPIWEVILGVLMERGSVPVYSVLAAVTGSKPEAPAKQLMTLLRKCPPDARQSAVPLMLMAEAIANAGIECEALRTIAKHAQVDIRLIERSVLEADKAKAAKPKPPKVSREGAKGAKKKPAKKAGKRGAK